MAELLSATDLPKGFVYPHEFVRVVELGLTNLEPWWILQGDLLRDHFVGLRKRYEKRRLVPFARREDNDDVACFDADSGTVVIIHDFTTPGWEQRAEYIGFYSWLRQAIEDLIAFE
ncbi:MAG TPA: hypothetical protein VF937_08125 [Chloroflexota bacterium]